MHCKCFPSVLFCSYFQMVLSFLAGSKHALVYANSGMHVTFFWFFAVSIYPLVSLIAVEHIWVLQLDYTCNVFLVA